MFLSGVCGRWKEKRKKKTPMNSRRKITKNRYRHSRDPRYWPPHRIWSMYPYPSSLSHCPPYIPSYEGPGYRGVWASASQGLQTLATPGGQLGGQWMWVVPSSAGTSLLAPGFGSGHPTTTVRDYTLHQHDFEQEQRRQQMWRPGPVPGAFVPAPGVCTPVVSVGLAAQAAPQLTTTPLGPRVPPLMTPLLGSGGVGCPGDQSADKTAEQTSGGRGRHGQGWKANVVCEVASDDALAVDHGKGSGSRPRRKRRRSATVVPTEQEQEQVFGSVGDSGGSVGPVGENTPGLRKGRRWSRRRGVALSVLPEEIRAAVEAGIEQIRDARAVQCAVAGCAQSFATKHDLAIHLRKMHRGLPVFVCPVEGCGREDVSPTARDAHVRVHTQERPFSCPHPHCGAAFVQKSNLVRHQVTHTGERRYVCPECGKGFAQHSTMTYHWMAHSGSGPYVCTVPGCSAHFPIAALFRSHLKTSHMAALVSAQDAQDAQDAPLPSEPEKTESSDPAK
jgi:hypothetical protein